MAIKKITAKKRASTRNKKKVNNKKRKSPGYTIEHYLGGVIRKYRRINHLTINEVSDLANISRGMLSRIERGDVSPSLDTLEKLSKALGVPISAFFRDYDIESGSAQIVKRGKGMEVVRRGTKKGHTYQLLAYEQGPSKSFEPFLITMDDASEVFPSFQHHGTEFLYMLKGKLEYRCGNNLYTLLSGDSLTFSGEIPHGPEKLIEVPIKFLSIISYSTEEKG